MNNADGDTDTDDKKLEALQALAERLKKEQMEAAKINEEQAKQVHDAYKKNKVANTSGVRGGIKGMGRSGWLRIVGIVLLLPLGGIGIFAGVCTGVSLIPKIYHSVKAGIEAGKEAKSEAMKEAEEITDGAAKHLSETEEAEADPRLREEQTLKEVETETKQVEAKKLASKKALLTIAPAGVAAAAASPPTGSKSKEEDFSILVGKALRTTSFSYSRDPHGPKVALGYGGEQAVGAAKG
jgi:hypothetical protein